MFWINYESSIWAVSVVTVLSPAWRTQIEKGEMLVSDGRERLLAPAGAMPNNRDIWFEYFEFESIYYELFFYLISEYIRYDLNAFV